MKDAVNLGESPVPVAGEHPARIVWLTVLFFASGFSGLVYQTVWLRMLVRALGVTVYAVSIVIAVFMTGLAIGSAIGGRASRSDTASALRLYGKVELLVGVFAVLSTGLMLVLPHGFRAIASGPGSSAFTQVARMSLAALVLLPPTTLMGATLPILTGATTGPAGRPIGLLYGANTLGAVVGVLSTGFFLIAGLGEIRSVVLAAMVNVGVGLAAWKLSTLTASSTEGRAEPDAPSDGALTDVARKVIAVAAVSGFCALALEVVWARLLSVLLGNSVYGFSSMLGAYLLGIGTGSLVITRWLDRLHRPLLAFAILELAGAVLAIVSLITFVELGLSDHDPRYMYSLLWGLGDFVRLFVYSALIVLPLTLIYGAIFPLASRLASPPGVHAGGAVGRLYAWNTLGGILGSLFAGLVLVPSVGTLRGFLITACAMLCVGLYVLRLAAKTEASARTAQVALAACALFAAAATSVSFEDPFLAVLLARLGDPTTKPLSHREDRGATVTAMGWNGLEALFINGLYVSATSPDVPLTMINFPLAFNPEPGPKRILAVGLGVGEALRFSIDTGHHITVVELHPAVVDTFRSLNPDADKYLGAAGSGVVIEDGRNYVLRSDEKFDLIVVDGSPPLYASGMANLYSVEFMNLVKAHLTPNGMFGLWFPVVCFERDFWSVYHSLSDTFSWVAVDSAPGSKNAFLVGSAADADPFTIDYPLFASRLSRWSTPTRTADPKPMWATSRYDRARLRERALAFPATSDDRPYTEFPLQSFLQGEPYLSDNRFLAFAFIPVKPP